jgi:hypothetical protein
MAYELKTKPTKVAVTKFLADQSAERKKECKTIIALMKRVTKESPKMWGPSIIGFGTYHYKYASGHEGDMCITGFSPRKAALTLYVMPGFERRHGDLMKKLGKYKAGKSCLYVKRLSDIDLGVLEKLIAASVKEGKATKWETRKGMER